MAMPINRRLCSLGGPAVGVMATNRFGAPIEAYLPDALVLGLFAGAGAAVGLMVHRLAVRLMGSDPRPTVPGSLALGTMLCGFVGAVVGVLVGYRFFAHLQDYMPGALFLILIMGAGTAFGIVTQRMILKLSDARSAR